VKELQAEQKKYRDLALTMGALHARIFGLDEIVFDPRTLIKCMFGCGDWGKGHTCPSRRGSLSLSQWRETLSRYSWGVIIHSRDAKLNQSIAYELERQAFFAGYYFAFSMSDCKLCATCAGHSDEPCRNPQKARPAFHSAGIDIFATARSFGLPIETLEYEGEPQNWYSAVFVE
jgi:predicted metal-binding protein